jgi:hypothetical protein
MAVGGLFSILAGCTSVQYARSADGRVVTQEKLRAVAIGMSEAEVEAMLGPPATVLPTPLHPGGHSLRYGGWKTLSSHYTVLWVHLNAEGRVVEIYSKLYGTWSPDDEPRAFVRTADRHWEGKVFATAFPSVDDRAAEQ